MSRRILLLAPHPFYQERGTPIAIDLLLKAFSQHGDTVDLVTFNEGEDREYPNVTMYRVKPPFRIEDVRPGFSAKKLMLDFFMFFTFLRLMFRHRYQMVHAVEESAFMALLVCPLFRTPFIYDMDSSMVTQIVNKFRFLKPLEGGLRWLESLPMRFSRAVIPVCDALADQVRDYRSDHIYVLKDVSLLAEAAAEAVDVENLRADVGDGEVLFMYIGNLESYQGIDLMLDAFNLAIQKNSMLKLKIIGGARSDVARYTDKVAQLQLSEKVELLGPRPVANIGAYMAQADVLVSPRTEGVNTPMKVYSYLHSGKAVLATDLPTHTQVMTSEIAELRADKPEDFSRGMLALAEDSHKRAVLAQKAHRFIEQEHSFAAFTEKLNGLYDAVSPAS